MPKTTWSAVEREDCFRDPRITVYTLPRPVTRLDLAFLRPFGPVILFEQFSRPFYRMDRPALFSLTGIIGAPEIRVTFKRIAADHVRNLVERQLGKMAGCDGCGECLGLCPEAALEAVPGHGIFISDSSCMSCLECVAAACGILNIDVLTMV